MKHVIVILSLLLSHVMAFAGPLEKGLAYQGLITTQAGQPLTSPNVKFRFAIVSPGPENCVLYDEEQPGNMSVDGTFNLMIGTGSSNYVGHSNPNPNLSLASAFDNASSKSALTCASGTSYVPQASDARKLRVSFFDGSVWTQLEDSVITSSPFAEHAESLQGLGKSNFVQINSSPAALTQANLESVFDSSTSVTELLALISGQSSAYLKSSGTINFSSPPTSSAAPSSANQLSNKQYVDSYIAGKSLDASIANLQASDAGKNLSWDGSKWVAQTAAASGISALTGEITASGSGSVAATITDGAVSNAKILSMDASKLTGSVDLARLPVGTAANNLLKLDALAKLPAVDASALTNVNASKIQNIAVSSTSPTSPGQVLAYGGSSYQPKFLSASDIRSSVANGAMFPTGCTASQVMTYLSPSDAYACTNISLPTSQLTGSLAASQLPALTGGDVTSAAGSGVLSLNNVGTAGTYSKVVVDAKGRVTSGQALAASDIPVLDAATKLSGTLAAAQLPAFSGDVVSTAGNSALTLSTTGVTPNTYGSASQIPQITVDSKGRITGITTATAAGGSSDTITAASALTLNAGTNIVMNPAASGTVEINGPVNMKGAYYEKVGTLSLTSCAASTSYSTNLYTVAACPSATTTITIPAVGSTVPANSAWSVTFLVTGATSSVFNVNYAGATTSVFWDKNSTNSAGGSSFAGLSVGASRVTVISCTLVNAASVATYCGVSAQY